MLNKTPKLYYTKQDLYDMKINYVDNRPIKIAFYTTFNESVSISYDMSSKISQIVLTYVPMRVVSGRETDIYYVLEGNLHIFENLGRD